ncbi:hypothetical protein F8M41_009867 [Gigaspora margarita]|uniref:Uncharacterized protein n=1 Tax=Gigaspora margarita TaxID=4874 RepID=A0A8H4A1N6_GIGMA|nr:hypothetical protein F8M41_009867 [Gigaspora margarita]
MSIHQRLKEGHNSFIILYSIGIFPSSLAHYSTPTSTLLVGTFRDWITATKIFTDDCLGLVIRIEYSITDQLKSVSLVTWYTA